MSILKSQQEAQRFLKQPPVHYSVATIGSVSQRGVTLIFPGESTPSQKRYEYNSAIAFSAGQRVYITRVNDTYFVICPITGGT